MLSWAAVFYREADSVDVMQWIDWWMRISILKMTLFSPMNPANSGSKRQYVPVLLYLREYDYQYDVTSLCYFKVRSPALVPARALNFLTSELFKAFPPDLTMHFQQIT
jgi:hypothetical protein